MKNAQVAKVTLDTSEADEFRLTIEEGGTEPVLFIVKGKNVGNFWEYVGPLVEAYFKMVCASDIEPHIISEATKGRGIKEYQLACVEVHD